MSAEEGKLTLKGAGVMPEVLIGPSPEWGEWVTVGKVCGQQINMREPLNKAAVECDPQSAMMYDLYTRLRTLEEAAKPGLHATTVKSDG